MTLLDVGRTVPPGGDQPEHFSSFSVKAEWTNTTTKSCHFALLGP